ncbi:MAG TPA: helix-turn-helix domain-containing protein [Clostridia bacterium]|nr:helix-turn-helix domain-containing protein [Clostridia bacterium]
MTNYRVGETIRKLRTQLAITQEDLCDGICAVPTLSRIENGHRLPSKAVFDALMQRMGRSSDVYDVLMSDHDFAIHEKKYEMRESALVRDFEKASVQLDEFNALIADDDEKLHRQFSLYMSVIIGAECGMPDIEVLEKLQKAISLTLPKYNKSKLNELYLDFDEITIINYIAIVYSKLGRFDEAIKLFTELEEYLTCRHIDAQEKMHTYPMVLHNLSKCLGQTERYLDCIRICDKGIQLCKQIDSTRLMAKFYYNRSWAIQKRGKPEQLDEAKSNIIFAYLLALSIDNDKNMQLYAEFAREQFGLELSSMFPYLQTISQSPSQQS